MANVTFKLTKDKTLTVMFRMTVIACSFVILFMSFMSRIILDQIHDEQKIEQNMIQEMSGLQSMQKYDHEDLTRLSEVVYGHRK